MGKKETTSKEQKNTSKVQIYGYVGSEKFYSKKTLHFSLEGDIQKLKQTPFITHIWAHQVKISDIKNEN